MKRTSAAIAATAITLALVAASPALAGTTVSLTFDDGRADNYVLKDMFAQRGMQGTFYVNSGRVGTNSYYLTWPQLDEFARNGNEIAGHTVNHADLTTLTYDQQRAEVCDDRQALIARGFNPVSFAYPFAKWNASARQVVQECGYSSGRGVGNGTETIPPRDAYVLRTPSDSNALSTLKGYVTEAESAGGGWVILVFHSIGSNGISEADMAEFLDWLGPRAASGTVVKTVGDVINASLPPQAPTGLKPTPRDGRVTLDWADNAEADLSGYDVYRATAAGGPYRKLNPGRLTSSEYADASAVNGTTYYYVVTASDASGNESERSSEVSAYPTATKAHNPSLEDDANGDSVPDCWMKLGYGTNSFRFTRTTDAHSGSYAERVEIINLTSGDRKLVVKHDSGACALQATPGQTYRLSAWYKSNVPTEFVVFTRTSAGNWGYWKSSGTFTATSGGWSQATWTTPAIPDGVTHLSFGLNLRQVGTLTVDDHEFEWVVPPPAPTQAKTRRIGMPPMGDWEAAAKVTRLPWEPRPENTAANHRSPTASELAEFSSAPPVQPYTGYVTGNFKGTTDELIQWAAWKWGVDEDVLRAVAVQESDWRQSMLGDYRNGAATSFGIAQIKDQWHDPGHPGTYPLSQESTAFNLDYYGRAFRSCYDGREVWLDPQGYQSGDQWGCVGLWFSGGWYDSGAEDYIGKVKAHLANRTWTFY